MRCFPGQQRQSHLYKNVGAIVGAYLRIDIPKLPHFDQYNYVLFTGARLLDRSGQKEQAQQIVEKLLEQKALFEMRGNAEKWLAESKAGAPAPKP